MTHEPLKANTDNMAAVVTRSGEEFRYVWVTRSYAFWLDLPPEKIVGRSMPDVIGPQAYETVRPYIEQVLSGRRVEYTAQVILAGRGRRSIHAVYVPLHSHGVEVDGWIATVVDVTGTDPAEQEPDPQSEAQASGAERELRRREAELMRIIRTLSMGEMATSIAHEVNQPLAGVVANAEAGLRWLSDDAPNVQQAKESLELIVRDGNRASAIIRSIREYLRKERGEMVALDMSEVIQEALAPVRAECLKRRIALRVDRFGPLPPVWGDRIQLQQVIFNLALNGVEAMASNEGAKELLVTSRRSASGGVLVAIRDCGAGARPKDVERIFDPFFTTKDSGMGLGLSISRSIVETHGGRIWAEPNEGPGLTFQFAVPAAAARGPMAANWGQFQADRIREPQLDS